MKPELRDYFAVHFAAALAAEQRYGIEFIAGRAYDLADAMIQERERRALVEIDDVAREEQREYSGGALLDEPLPLSEQEDELDPRWLDPRDEPVWERDDGPLFASVAEARPGLARAQPQPADDAKKRSMGS